MIMFSGSGKWSSNGKELLISIVNGTGSNPVIGTTTVVKFKYAIVAPGFLSLTVSDVETRRSWHPGM